MRSLALVWITHDQNLSLCPLIARGRRRGRVQRKTKAECVAGSGASRDRKGALRRSPPDRPGSPGERASDRRHQVAHV